MKVAARSLAKPLSRAAARPIQRPRGRDAHERQADDRASRFVQGERGLAQQLSPTSAAQWCAAASTGERLPKSLQEQLELAFGADLSALRLHRDAAAQAAARGLGAEAFAAGAAIFFGSGAYRPDSVLGQQLIAHEVAHSLQQAGRAAWGGRQRIEAHPGGNGAVQRQPAKAGSINLGDLFKEVDQLQPAQDTQACIDAVELRASTDGASLSRQHADAIQRAVKAQSLEDASAAVTALWAAVPETDRTDAVRSVYFDALKALNADTQAAEVVGKTFPAETAFASWSFFETQRRGDGAWVKKLLREHPVAGKYYPRAIVAVARIDFYGMTRGALDLDPAMQFNKTIHDALAQSVTPQPLMPEERTAVALRALLVFDAIRLAPFRELAASLKGKTTLWARFQAKLAFLRNYTDPTHLRNLAAINTSDPEVLQIAAEVADLLVPVAQRADRFWRNVLALLQRTLVTDAAKLDDKAQAARLQQEVQRRLPAIKPLAGTQRSLQTILAQATRLERGGAPSATTLARQMKQAAVATAQLIYRVDGALAARDRQLKVNDFPGDSSDQDVDITDTRAEAVTDDMVYGVVLLLLYTLHDLMVDQQAPARTKDVDQQALIQDEALFKLRKVSLAIANLGMVLGYNDLRTAAQEVEFAQQSDLKTSRIALLGPLVGVPASLEDFQRDFPTGRMTSGAISGLALVQMVYALFYENLNAKLLDALLAPSGTGTREFDYDPNKKAIFSTALDAAKADLHMPRKYHTPAKETVLYVRPQDQDRVADFQPVDNPHYKAFIASELGVKDSGYVPQNINAHLDGFVVWILPDMDRFVARLAQVPGVTDLPDKNGNAIGQPSDYEKPRDWLDALNKAAAASESQREALALAAQKWIKDSLSALDAPARRATSNLRRSVLPLIAEQWESLTHSFLKNPDAYFKAPREALRLTLGFAASVQPSRAQEQRLQMTALMLELAPVYSRKLASSTHFGSLVRISGTDRLDIVLPLYAHVLGAAELAADPANAPLLGSLDLDFAPPDLSRRASLLRHLAGEFKATAEAVQEQVLLEGDPAANRIQVPGRGYPITGKSNPDEQVNDTFMVEGIVYNLVKVHKSFRFQPELLTKPSGFDWGGPETLGKRRLWVDGQAVAPGAEPIKLVSLIRTTPDGAQRELHLTSDDVAMLSELTYAVHMHIVIKQLEDLAGALEVFADVILTAMQLAFPEVAPQIAYAEIGGTILRFWGSPEFAMLKGALDGDASALFDRGLSELKDELSLEALWDYLLFDNEPPIFRGLRMAAGLVGRMKLVGDRGDDKTRSAVGRVFGGLVKVGGELVHGAEAVHQYIDFPVRKLALFVEGSPWVALMLRVIARNLYRLQDLSLAEVGVDKAVDMVTQAQDMYRRFEEVIDALGNYELPEELVPLEAIVEMVVNLVLDRLPAKYRLPLKGARHIGAVEDIFQWLFGKIAEQMRKMSLDPNILWRTHARDLLNPYLHEAGKTVSDEVHGLLKQVPFLHDLAAMNVNDIVAQFVTKDVDAAQPSMAQPGSAPRSSLHLPVAGGQDLPMAQKLGAQRGFGHDFSHVRLHRSGDVDRGLRSAGAQAATSGSHVYIDSRMNLGSDQGRDTLHHELAHVLQQVGPRPLGTASASGAVAAPSEMGRGWRIDAGPEAEADRLAAQSRTAARAPRAVRHALRARGPQPKLTDVIAKFFTKLGDPSKLQEHAHEMMERTPDAAAMKQAAPSLKDHFADKLIEALKTYGQPGSVVAFASPFALSAQDLVDYVVNNRKEELRKGLPNVLMAGLQQHTHKKKKDDQSKPDQNRFWSVNPSRVETSLEEFFFGATGLSVDVELKTRVEAGPDGKERKTVDPDLPFIKLKFNYLHLPMLGGTAKVWTDIVTNTFPKVAADKLALYQNKTRLALLGLQPGPFIFDSAKRNGAKVLVLGKTARELIEAYVNPPPARDLPGDEVPPWADYIKPDPQTRSPTYGQIGLRLGFYQDRDNPDQQKGTDRASHHTVQYLLLEYLLNSKDRHQPFPNSLDLYPNVVGSGGKVDSITSQPGGVGDKINVSANEAGRGGGMPTILLSVHAHTLGDVHISPQPDDLPTQSASQGSAIHGVYRNALGDHASLVLGKAPPLVALKAKSAGKSYKPADIPHVAGQETTLEALSTATFNAACKTYTWMRKEMNDKLERAIDTREKEYYESLVASAHKTSIFANGKPQPGYEAKKVGAQVIKDVLAKQKSSLESAAFGFKEMS